MNPDIEQTYQKLKEQIDEHLKGLEADMRLRHAQLDEKLKRGQQIDLQTQDLQRQKEYLDKEKALVEAQKTKNSEKEAFLARKEEKIATQTARLQQMLSE